jgi:cutinase
MRRRNVQSRRSCSPDTGEGISISCRRSGAITDDGANSQGAALMHNAVSGLPENIKTQLAGGVLFGDTKNQQSGGKIANFSPEKTLILCAKDDGVCYGKLNVNAGHVSYLNNGAIPRAINFLSSKIDKVLGGKRRR